MQNKMNEIMKSKEQFTRNNIDSFKVMFNNDEKLLTKEVERLELCLKKSLERSNGVIHSETMAYMTEIKDCRTALREVISNMPIIEIKYFDNQIS